MTRYVMVPETATDEMIRAAERAMFEHVIGNDFHGLIFAAMLKAAPEWEPTDEDVERVCKAYDKERWNRAPADEYGMRAAIQAMGRG